MFTVTAGHTYGFYSVARLFSQGGLIILAGYLEARMDVPHAWMAILAAMGLILVALSLYHARALPIKAHHFAPPERKSGQQDSGGWGSGGGEGRGLSGHCC